MISCKVGNLALVMTGKPLWQSVCTCHGKGLTLFCSFGTVICDESHALKTHSAKRTQFIWPLVQKAKRAILITGTPALSRPIELFPQVHLLHSLLWVVTQWESCVVSMHHSMSLSKLYTYCSCVLCLESMPNGATKSFVLTTVTKHAM